MNAQDAPTTNCPHCGTALATEVLTEGATAICVQCRQSFVFQPVADRRRTSRKALASLVLGLATTIAWCLAAIPAFVLGVMALAEIRRHEDRLKGRWAAVTGIVTSLSFGFLCLPVALALIMPAIQASRGMTGRSDPIAVRAIAGRMPPCQLPEGLEPIYGFEAVEVGMREVVFVDQQLFPQALVCLVEQRPAWTTARMQQNLAKRAIDRGLALEFHSLEPWSLTIGDRQVEVTRQEGVWQISQRHYRQYVGLVPRGEEMLAVMVLTAIPAPDQTTAATADVGRKLTEDEVREFFESCGEEP